MAKKNPAAVALGKLGGKIGGKAQVKKGFAAIPPELLAEIREKALKTRRAKQAK